MSYKLVFVLCSGLKLAILFSCSGLNSIQVKIPIASSSKTLTFVPNTGNMNTTSNKSAIADFTNALLNLSTEDEAKVKENINEICYVYQELTGLNGRDVAPEFITNVPTAVGISLSLNHAASCITDYNRTLKLLKGFVQAIRDQQKEHPDETINIFYAGCGPFALFMTIVAPIFTPEEVQFTLLEVNKKSMEVARDVVAKLELDEYLADSFTADAILFEVPDAEKYHILFSETLDALLHREGYVPILWNLLPQFKKDIVVIPENVQITVNYKKGEEEVPFGTAFDTRAVLKETPKTDLLPSKFDTKSLSLKDAPNYDSIVIDTLVTVYKDAALTRGESSISLAIEVPIEKPVIHEYVDFVYELNPTPAFKFGVR